MSKLDDILTLLENQVAADVAARQNGSRTTASPRHVHLNAKRQIQALMFEMMGEYETLQEQSGYDRKDVPHKETDRSVDGSILYMVRQASRNLFRSDMRKKVEEL